MADTRKPVTTIGVSVETRDAIAAETLQLGAQLGRRISIGDVVRAAFLVAKRHPDELSEELGDAA